jgi:hypothetical protein
LAQVFGRSFHSAMLDVERQEFYRKALTTLTTSVPSAFVVILGLGSVLPMLTAKQHFQGMLLESSEKLGKLAEELLTNNQNENFEVGIVKALDDTGKKSAILLRSYLLFIYITFFWINTGLTCDINMIVT